jgi:hypothetical protein
MTVTVGAKHVAIVVIAVLCGVCEALAHMSQWGVPLPFHLTAGVCLAAVASLGMICKDIRDLPTNTPVNASLLVNELPAVAQAVVPVASAVAAPAPAAIAPQVAADMAPVLDELTKAGAK